MTASTIPTRRRTTEPTAPTASTRQYKLVKAEGSVTFWLNWRITVVELRTLREQLERSPGFGRLHIQDQTKLTLVAVNDHFDVVPLADFVVDYLRKECKASESPEGTLFNPLSNFNEATPSEAAVLADAELQFVPVAGKHFYLGGLGTSNMRRVRLSRDISAKLKSQLKRALLLSPAITSVEFDKAYTGVYFSGDFSLDEIELYIRATITRVTGFSEVAFGTLFSAFPIGYKPVKKKDKSKDKPTDSKKASGAVTKRAARKQAAKPKTQASNEASD